MSLQSSLFLATSVNTSSWTWVLAPYFVMTAQTDYSIQTTCELDEMEDRDEMRRTPESGYPASDNPTHHQHNRQTTTNSPQTLITQ